MTESVTSKIRLTKLGYCPSCKTPSAPAPLYILSRTEVFRCVKCSLDYIDPSLDAKSMMDIYTSSETLKEINPACENYYEYQALDPKSLTYRDYYKALKAADGHVRGRELLEVGCGTGGFLEFAKSHGWKVCGLDSSTENIQKLKERGIAGLCENYFEYRGGNKYDVIVMWDLIEHPQDPLAFVKKSAELLKQGGILLLATPCYPNLLSILAGWFYKLSNGKNKGPAEKLYFLEHTTYFGLETLRPLLAEGGFDVATSWKTETDLVRYSFSPVTRMGLKGAFLLARLLRLQNRLTVLARKR